LIKTNKTHGWDLATVETVKLAAMAVALLTSSSCLMETPMRILNLSAVAMAASLLIAAPAFAQSAAGQKQRTDEGGPSMQMPCGQPYNANAAADPNCKQRTQTLNPSSAQAQQGAGGKSN
jgi:hypothetical protein